MPASSTPEPTRFSTFAEFYPYYLSEHQNDTCRRLHYAGSSLVIILLLYSLLSGNLWWLLALPIAGYGFAWVGHFFLNTTSRRPLPIPFTVFWETGSCCAMR